MILNLFLWYPEQQGNTPQCMKQKMMWRTAKASSDQTAMLTIFMKSTIFN